MRQFVSHLSDGDSVQETFLVSEKQLRANRNGNLYLQLELRDRSDDPRVSRFFARTAAEEN